MPKLTPDQLQVWYAKLKTTLYETVNVDLTRKEDLGRVRIIRINEWHHDNPDIMPDADMIYPFIPHRPLREGEQSQDPLLTYYCYDPPAPDKTNMEAYQQWLLSSISVTPTNDLLQELYDMSAEGQLMVYDAAEEPGLHQIQNNDGEITVTDRFDNIQFQLAPEVVPPPQDSPPVLPPKPKEPAAPGEEPKGFWTRVGYLLGIQTKYAQYVQRKKAYDDYLENMTTWSAECANRTAEWEADAPGRMERLQQQTEAFSRYYQEVSMFLLDPLTRFSIAWGGFGEKIKNLGDGLDEQAVEQLSSEGAFWTAQHKNTLQGSLQTVVDDANNTLKNLRDVLKFTEQMFGPVYKHNAERALNGIFQKHSDVKAYAAPLIPGTPINDRQAAWICLAALADPMVLALEAPGNPMMELGSQERYQKIMDGFLLKGQEDSDPLFHYVREARTAGSKAMQEYARGNAKQLAGILSNGIRRQNELATYQGDTYSLKSFGITAGLLEVLDSHPDLMEHCTLRPEELQQARANVAIYRMNEQGLQAKADLLSYSLYQKPLSAEEMHTAVTDLLFLNTMDAQAANKQDISALMGNPKAAQAAKQLLAKQVTPDTLSRLDRTEIGKAAAVPQALFAWMAQLNPEAQKPPQAKTMDAPQVSHQNAGHGISG